MRAFTESYCVPTTVLSAHVVTQLILTASPFHYYYPISQVGNGGTERLSEADQVTQLVKGGALVGTLVVQMQSPSSELAGCPSLLK